jgi:hypothetical protein
LNIPSNIILHTRVSDSSGNPSGLVRWHVEADSAPTRLAWERLKYCHARKRNSSQDEFVTSKF